jgi:hypothetical protein
MEDPNIIIKVLTEGGALAGVVITVLLFLRAIRELQKQGTDALNRITESYERTSERLAERIDRLADKLGG